MNFYKFLHPRPFPSSKLFHFISGIIDWKRTILLQRIMQRHWKKQVSNCSCLELVAFVRVELIDWAMRGVRESRQGWNVNKDGDASTSCKIVAIYPPIISLSFYWWYLCRKKMCKRKIAPTLEAIQCVRQFARNS